MMRKAVILAGGKGTRLASVVSDKPKPMADVNGLPFLHYVILDLKSKGITEIVLLVGYLKDVIIDYFESSYHGLKISYEVEHEPRGTGGLIYELSNRWSEPILLINGDTYFDVDIQGMYRQYETSHTIQMAVREVYRQDRYGALEISNHRIVDFREKTYIERGYINGGIYLLPTAIFSNHTMPYSFSLEKDFFEQYKEEVIIEPFYSDGYFIDIGIPEDYQTAQLSIPKMIMPNINSSWTLYLDRDGVINTHRPADYVKSIDEFEWIEGAKEAIVYLSKIFGRIVVVTNQQGIGKGLMSEYDLDKIHWKIQNEISELGGKIDRIYHCPHLASIQCSCRKPKSGMAAQSREDFSEIDYSKSIMVGDMPTDMDFANTIGALAINVGSIVFKKESLKFKNLRDFSDFLQVIRD